MKPHYDAHGVTLYVGDAREILPSMVSRRGGGADLLVIDPPYGIRAMASGMRVKALARKRIAHDCGRAVSVEVVRLAWDCLRGSRHAYVFGPFRLGRLPHATGCCDLVWDKGILGMGDMRRPWAPQHEPIPFRGQGGLRARRAARRLARARSVGVGPPVQAPARERREAPHHGEASASPSHPHRDELPSR